MQARKKGCQKWKQKNKHQASSRLIHTPTSSNERKKNAQGKKKKKKGRIRSKSSVESYLVDRQKLISQGPKTINTSSKE